MHSRIIYIELKTGYSDNGPAWIGKAEFSKSGQTIYFNGHAFKKLTGHAYAYSSYANYYDLETKEEYWISGIKKNGQDRHKNGSGRIQIDRNIIDEYLELVDFDRLDDKKYDLVDVKPTDKKRFAELENEKII